MTTETTKKSAKAAPTSTPKAKAKAKTQPATKAPDLSGPSLTAETELLRNAMNLAKEQTTGAQVVAGSVTMAQCKLTQAKCLGKTGYSTNPAHGIDPDRSPLEVDQQEFRDASVDSVIAGDARVVVVQATDDTETSVQRPCTHDTDQESVVGAVIVQQTIGGTPITPERVQVGLIKKQGAKAASRGRSSPSDAHHKRVSVFNKS